MAFKLEVEFFNFEFGSKEDGILFRLPSTGPILIDIDPVQVNTMAADADIALHEIFLPNGKKVVLKFQAASLQAVDVLDACAIGGGMCKLSFTTMFVMDNSHGDLIQVFDVAPAGGVRAQLFDWEVRCEVRASGK